VLWPTIAGRRTGPPARPTSSCFEVALLVIVGGVLRVRLIEKGPSDNTVMPRYMTATGQLDVHAEFPTAGTYQPWAQVRLAAGTVITAPFTVQAD
jgi:hypothetical protein